MSDDRTEQEWTEIADYVATVARNAFRHGYSTGWCDAGGPVTEIDREQQLHADMYIVGGFEPETVRKYFPRPSPSRGLEP